MALRPTHDNENRPPRVTHMLICVKHVENGANSRRPGQCARHAQGARGRATEHARMAATNAPDETHFIETHRSASHTRAA